MTLQTCIRDARMSQESHSYYTALFSQLWQRDDAEEDAGVAVREQCLCAETAPSGPTQSPHAPLYFLAPLSFIKLP